MNSFNWARAAEGAIVSGLLAGTAVIQPLANGGQFNPRNVGLAFGATALCAFIKGIGQSYQAAATVQTVITQPAGTSAITETIASPSPSKDIPISST